MPALPFRRISQSCPRTCARAVLVLGQADLFDQFGDPDQSRPHVRRQLGQFGVDRLVHRLDGPHHRNPYTRYGIAGRGRGAPAEELWRRAGYSRLSASTGSRRAAARAGIQAASSAAPTSSTPVARNTCGSSGDTSYSRVSIQRVSTAAALSPTLAPA